MQPKLETQTDQTRKNRRKRHNQLTGNLIMAGSFLSLLFFGYQTVKPMLIRNSEEIPQVVREYYDRARVLKYLERPFEKIKKRPKYLTDLVDVVKKDIAELKDDNKVQESLRKDVVNRYNFTKNSIADFISIIGIGFGALFYEKHRYKLR